MAVPARVSIAHGWAMSLRGTAIEGELQHIDPATSVLRFCMQPGGAALALPFARFRRLTMTAPLTAVPRALGVPVWRVPVAEEEREYRLFPESGGAPLTGSTLGHVETPHGMFLFKPVNEDRAVQRVFVPRTGCARSEFGPTAVDEAAERWIGTPHELLAALERQHRMPVLPLGDSLLALGMVTRSQLARALAEPAGEQPLGERLVSQGVIAGADLQTALAHKMGYPIVDLSRFPIEAQAVRGVPMRKAAEFRALPLMLHEGRMIVAVDRLSRVNRLRELQVLLQLGVVPVLASQKHIELAFGALVKQDMWSANVPVPPDLFATTR
jgi:hypothetical protein